MHTVKSFVTGLALVLCLAAGAATAGEWKPDSAVNVRVPFAAGSIMDMATRIVAQGLQDKYGQTVIVNNMVGANGAVAANDLLANPASPTEMGSAAIALFTLSPLFNKDIQVNLDDFTIVSNMISEEFILFTCPEKSGITSYEELIGYGKSNRVLFGSNVPGGMTHMLQTALFGSAGVEARAVTSSGSNKDLLALLSGDVVCAVATTSLATQFVQDGSIVPILVYSKEPYTGYEGFTVPTTVSKGCDVVFRSANFLMVKSGVEQSIVDQMYRDIQDFYKTEKFKTLAANANYVPDHSDGAATRRLILDSMEICKKAFDTYYAK